MKKNEITKNLENTSNCMVIKLQRIKSVVCRKTSVYGEIYSAKLTLERKKGLK